MYVTALFLPVLYVIVLSQAYEFIYVCLVTVGFMSLCKCLIWKKNLKECKEEQGLCGNWLKVCYLLHIIHPQSIFPIFLITFLNSDIDLLVNMLGNLFQINDPRKCIELVP